MLLLEIFLVLAYQKKKKKINTEKKESKEKKLNDFLWCVTCVINLQEQKDKKGKFCKAKEARKNQKSAIRKRIRKWCGF